MNAKPRTKILKSDKGQIDLFVTMKREKQCLWPILLGLENSDKPLDPNESDRFEFVTGQRKQTHTNSQ
jgi:hypothetical protein